MSCCDGLAPLLAPPISLMLKLKPGAWQPKLKASLKKPGLKPMIYASKQSKPPDAPLTKWSEESLGQEKRRAK